MLTDEPWSGRRRRRHRFEPAGDGPRTMTRDAVFRECLAIRIDRTLTSTAVIDVLTDLFMPHEVCSATCDRSVERPLLIMPCRTLPGSARADLAVRHEAAMGPRTLPDRG